MFEPFIVNGRKSCTLMDSYAAKVESHPTDKLYFGLTAEMVLLLEQKTCTDVPKSSAAANITFQTFLHRIDFMIWKIHIRLIKGDFNYVRIRKCFH